jgi:superfamily I DNA/RNA helicase
MHVVGFAIAAMPYSNVKTALGSMKRIKGLEFRAVAMACADPKDPMHNLRQANVLSRCERYVAATRAREHLLVTLLEIS